MWAGKSTVRLYEECIKAGLCPTHLREFDSEELHGSDKHELQRKALLFARLSILKPIVFGKAQAPDSIKYLMSKPEYRSNFNESKDEYTNVVRHFDSVVVFTMCTFSRICCAGALFHAESKPVSNDPALQSLLNLLSCSEKLTEKNMLYFHSILRKNFEDADEENLKFYFIVILLIARKLSIKMSLKTAVKELGKQLQSAPESELLLNEGTEAYKEERYEEAVTAFTLALTYSPYCKKVRTSRAQAYIQLKKYKKAELDSYLALVIDPNYCKAYSKLCSSLYHQNFFQQVFQIAEYGLEKCNNRSCNQFEVLETLKTDAEDLDFQMRNLEDNEHTELTTEENHCGKKKELPPDSVEDVPDLIEASESEDESESENEDDFTDDKSLNSSRKQDSNEDDFTDDKSLNSSRKQDSNEDDFTDDKSLDSSRKQDSNEDDFTDDKSLNSSRKQDNNEDDFTDDKSLNSSSKQESSERGELLEDMKQAEAENRALLEYQNGTLGSDEQGMKECTEDGKLKEAEVEIQHPVQITCNGHLNLDPENQEEINVTSDEYLSPEKQEKVTPDEYLSPEKREKVTSDEYLSPEKQEKVTSDEYLSSENQEKITSDEDLRSEKQEKVTSKQDSSSEKQQKVTSEEDLNPEKLEKVPSDEDLNPEKQEKVTFDEHLSPEKQEKNAAEHPLQITSNENLNLDPEKQKKDKIQVEIQITSENLNSTPGKQKIEVNSTEQAVHITSNENFKFYPEKQEETKTQHPDQLTSQNFNFHLKLEKDIEKIKCKVIKNVKEASEAMLKGLERPAILRYREVLSDLKNEPQLDIYEECDIVCIKYALGIAYWKAGDYDDLQKSIDIFKGILEDHTNVTFPAAYYGLGLAYHKLNRFKDSLIYLKVVHDILEKGIRFKEYVWPELDILMDDTKSEHLKIVVVALIEECENPPSPVAVCLYNACQFNQPIYYSDPGFKGFFSMFCCEHCSLHYHPQCWKELKNSKGLTEKEFLAQPCFTPDCEGVIFKVTNTTKEGIIGKTFQLPESKKETKQKKSKLERKLEGRDNRKRKRRDSKCDSISDVTSEVASENASTVPPMKNEGNKCTNEIKQNEITVTSNLESKLLEAETPSTSKLSVDAQPFYVLKKPAIDENSHKTPSKVKEPKKFKGNTLSIDDFYENVTYCYNFKKRNSFPQNNSQLFFPSRWSDGNINEGSEINTSDLLGSHGGAPELESIKSNVYSYLEELLTLRGPLRIDDPILVDELKNFPTEANIMIADCGGIGEFLKNNIRFAYVGNTYVCVAADVVAAYNKCRNSLSFNDETFYDSNILETFEEDDNKSVTSGSSYLNPDAKEYSPVSSKLSDVPPTENAQRSQSITVSSGVDNSRRNSESLLSVVSKLRQPIVVDDKLTNFGSTSSINNELPSNELLQIGKLSDSVQSISSDSNLISNAESNNAENSSLEKKLDINIPQFIKILQNYSSDEMRKHHLDIESAIKPYSIVILPKKCSRIIQTEEYEAEKLSRGVQKNDEEFERIKEVAMILADDKHMLREQNAQLQKQLDVALDSATKSQKKSSVEIINLKATLEEIFAELEAEKKANKNKELKWEKELKHLQDSLNKANEKIDEQKRENETLNMNLESMRIHNEDLNEKLKEARSNIKHLEDKLCESELARTSFELQGKLYTETIESLEQKICEMTERAKTAEHQVLKLKKSEFMKRIDQKISEAGERMKELQGGIPLVSASLNPVIIKNMETLLTQIRSYINKLGEIRHVFMRSIDHQIQRVTSGTPLKDLPPLEVAELPQIPKWSQANAQAMNFMPQQIPPLIPPVQSEIKIPSLPLAASGKTESSAPYLNSKTPVSSFQPVVQSGMLNPLLQSSVQTGALNSTFQSAVQSGTLVKDMITKSAPTSSLKKLSSDVQEKEKTALSLNNPKISQPSSSAIKVDNLSSNVTEVEGKGASNRMASPDLELGYKVAENGIGKPTPVYNTADIQKKPAVSESKNSYEKLLSKLQMKYPNYSQAHLMSFVKDYRSQRKGKLSGLTLETIINEVSEFIESQRKTECSMSEAAKKSRLLQNKVLVNKKIACDEPVVVENAPAPKKAAWNVTNDSNRNWSGSSIEDCVICCEEMDFSTAYKADCGHRFHLTCIREWLNKKSDCPICRVYLLLPEDYPALS